MAPIVLLLILAGFGLAHALIVGAILVSIVLPNPIAQLRDKGPPEAWGLNPERTIVGDGSPAWYVNRPGTDCAVLVCHGKSRSKKWMLPLIAEIAQQFPVLAIDFPSHGEHRYGTTSVGLREADTVGFAIDWLVRRGHERVLVYGVSMGGASSIISIGRDEPSAVIGLVTDGTFDELPNVIRNITNKLPIPRYLQRSAFAIARRIVGSEPSDVRPILFAPNLKIPCLFLHGEHDRLVPPECAEALAMVTDHGERRLYNGGHDEPYNKEMQRHVMTFLQQTAST